MKEYQNRVVQEKEELDAKREKLGVEPVMWQYRYMESEYVYSPDGSRWSKWMTVEARIGGTVQTTLDEIQFYNDNDMGHYEIRALYARQEAK